MLNTTDESASATEISAAIVSYGEIASADNFKDAEEKDILSENDESATTSTAIKSAILIEENNLLSSTQIDNSFNNKNESSEGDNEVRNTDDNDDLSSIDDINDENSNNSNNNKYNNCRHYAYSKTNTSKNNNFTNTYEQSKRNIQEILGHSTNCNFLSGK